MPVLSGIKAPPRRAAAKPPPKAPDAPGSAPPGQGASAPVGQGASVPVGQGASAPAGQGSFQSRQTSDNAAGARAVAAPGPAIPPGGVSGIAPALPPGTAGAGAGGASGNALSGALPTTAGEPNLVVPAGSAAHGSSNPRPNFAGGQGTNSR
jgi:hypothetical protein